MGKLFSKKYVAYAIAVAVICGFLRAFWLFGALPSQGALLAAAQGKAYAAWLWKSGGAVQLQNGYASVEALWGFGVALVILLVAGVLARRARWAIVGVATLGVLAWSIFPFLRGWKYREQSITDPRLIMPLEQVRPVEKLRADEVFLNPEAAALLPLVAPQIAGGPTVNAAALVGDPKAWREALRKSRWKAVLLSGPASNYRPLLDHLVSSPDWTLVAITNTGYVFLRGEGTVVPPFNPDNFKLANDRETAIYLAQLSSYFDALRRNNEARACVDRALKLSPENPLVLSYAATYAAAHKQWQEAIDYAQKARAADPQFLQAQAVEAMALLELGQPSRAEQEAAEVLAQAPDDFYTLFLYARICRAENDFTKEAATLEHVVELCRKNGMPTGHYQLYLGQSYARLGMAKPALLNYQAALESGLLDPKQMAEVRDAIKTIESRDKP